MPARPRVKYADKVKLALNLIFGRDVIFTDPSIPGALGISTYKGAETHRLTPFSGSRRLHPDDESRISARLLRARAHELVSNTGHGTRFIRMLKKNIVGSSGFLCAPQNRDAKGELLKDVNARIAAEWYRFADGPVTADGRQNITSFLQLLAGSWGTDGEVFVRRWFGYPNDWGLALEPIDADLIDESYSLPAGKGRDEIRLGIEVDGFGRPKAYHALQSVRPSGVSQQRTRYPAREIGHAFFPLRVNQTRGISLFAPVLVNSGHLGVYFENEIVASSAAAAKMGMLEQNGEAGSALAAPKPGQSGATPGRYRIELAPGTTELLPPGVQFKPWDPTHPVDAFPDFVNSVLREISCGFDVNYNTFANDGRGTSFSQGRLQVQDERDTWRMLQHWFAWAVVQPIYEAWLEAAVMTGKLQLGTYDWRRFRACSWRPRSWPYNDPLKDQQANALGLRLMQTSPQRLASDQGLDFEELVEENKAAKVMLEKAGLPTNLWSGESVAPAPDDPDDDPDKDDKTDPPKDTGKNLTNGHGQRPPRLAQLGIGG